MAEIALKLIYTSSAYPLCCLRLKRDTHSFEYYIIELRSFPVSDIVQLNVHEGHIYGYYGEMLYYRFLDENDIPTLYPARIDTFDEVQDYVDRLFYDETDKVDQVETADPIKTQLFEDAQSVSSISRKTILGNVRRIIVTYAIVSPQDISMYKALNSHVRYTGFASGRICSAIIYRFYYYFIDGVLVYNQMTISNGNVIAISNSFYDDELSSLEESNRLTGIIAQLRDVIAEVDPANLYKYSVDNPINATMSYWSHLISENSDRIMCQADRADILRGYRIGADEYKYHKFTAIARNKDAYHNMVSLMETLFYSQMEEISIYT